MQWLEVAITTTAEAVEAVAARVEALGSAGAVIEEPARVIAYWPADQETDGRLGSLRQFLADLSRFGLEPGPAQVEVAWRDEAEWAEGWKRFYHTQRIGRLVIRPSWEEYRPGTGEVVVELDPGMAFGTGTHPTTTLCLEALAEEIAGGEFVADAGTGSGILAIAAVRLGAERVAACDNDPVACRVAEENARRNGVAERVAVACRDAGTFLRELGRPADLILANIVPEVIVDLAPELGAALKAGGRLFASGIVAERRAEVAQALEAKGLVVSGVREREGWVLLGAVRPTGWPGREGGRG
ncbi:MAG: 50S ribosomal protein L11 methyltransferase [Betaproteobacteria bacterium]